MENLESKPCYDMRFQHGSTHLLVGSSGAGKTFRCCNILANKHLLLAGGENIKNVVFCYNVWQDVYDTIKKQGIVTKFVNKKPSCEDFVNLVSSYKDQGGSIVVIDDFMSEIDVDLVKIVTVHSRHYNTSTFILFQCLFPAKQLGRQISLNIKYLHLHKNPRENAQVQSLARQLAPEPRKYKAIVAAYHEVTKKPHSCFLIDTTQTCPEHLRYRSNYLPHEGPMIVWIVG